MENKKKLPNIMFNPNFKITTSVLIIIGLVAVTYILGIYHNLPNNNITKLFGFLIFGWLFYDGFFRYIISFKGDDYE